MGATAPPGRADACIPAAGLRRARYPGVDDASEQGFARRDGEALAGQVNGDAGGQGAGLLQENGADPVVGKVENQPLLPSSKWRISSIAADGSP